MTNHRLTRPARLCAAASLTIVPAAALIIMRLLWGSDLPPTVASHWSGSTPDGFSTTTTFFAVTAVLSLLASAIALGAAVADRESAPLVLLLTATTSATCASTWILSVALTRSAGAPEDARIGWWVVAPIAASMLGIAAYALGVRTRISTPALPTPTLNTPLVSTERAVWIGRAHSRWPWIGAAVLLAVTVAGAVYSDWWIAVILLASALLTAAFASITVRVDRSGLSITSWGLRWKKIALSRVRSASVDTIRPMEWGGWGYRITPRGTAVTLRAGDAVVLTLDSGKLFAVTVDHPEDAVKLINSLVVATTER